MWYHMIRLLGLIFNHDLGWVGILKRKDVEYTACMIRVYINECLWTFIIIWVVVIWNASCPSQLMRTIDMVVIMSKEWKGFNKILSVEFYILIAK